MRPSVLLLCSSFCLTAQIQDLATTDDGTVLYFSTPYRLKGSSDVGYSKIFRYTDNEFQLFREIVFMSFGTDTNFYLAVRPSVSGEWNYRRIYSHAGLLRRQPLPLLCLQPGIYGKRGRHR